MGTDLVINFGYKKNVFAEAYIGAGFKGLFVETFTFTNNENKKTFRFMLDKSNSPPLNCLTSGKISLYEIDAMEMEKLTDCCTQDLCFEMFFKGHRVICGHLIVRSIHCELNNKNDLFFVEIHFLKYVVEKELPSPPPPPPPPSCDMDTVKKIVKWREERPEPVPNKSNPSPMEDKNSVVHRSFLSRIFKRKKTL